MKHQALTELQECERKVIDVFARHGRDGRAITVESLAAGADISVSSPELTAALKGLAVRGIIQRAEGDLYLARQSRFGCPRTCFDAVATQQGMGGLARLQAGESHVDPEPQD
jgi:hypothetical protein